MALSLPHPWQWWRRLPGIWKLILPPVVAVFLFYGIENTRGYLLWNKKRAEIVARGGWFTPEEYWEVNGNPESGEFADQVSFIREWTVDQEEGFGIEPEELSIMFPVDRAGFLPLLYTREPLGAKAYLKKTEPVEETLLEIEAAGNAPLNYVKLGQSSLQRDNTDDLLPLESMIELETILYYRLQAHALMNKEDALLRDFRIFLILRSKVNTLLNLEGPYRNFHESLVASAFLSSKWLGESGNQVRLDLVRELLSYPSTPELSAEDYQVLRWVVVEVISQFDSHFERNNEIADILGNALHELVDFEADIPYRYDIVHYISEFLKYLYPSGWLNLSKRDLCDLISDWENGKRATSKGFDKVGIRNIIFSDWNSGGWIDDLSELKQSHHRLYSLAAAGLALDWFTIEKGHPPRDLKELYQSIPQETGDLGNACQGSGISLNPEKKRIETSFEDVYWPFQFPE